MGGMYLFANRETAEAYLNHPVIQAVCSNPAVLSTESSCGRSRVPSRLSRGPLCRIFRQYFKTRRPARRRSSNAESHYSNPSGKTCSRESRQFAGQVVTDLAAAMAGVMTNLGHKLGLYQAMAESGPIHFG